VYLINPRSIILKFCYEILMQNWEEKLFSKQQSGVGIYMKSVIIMEHQKL